MEKYSIANRLLHLNDISSFDDSEADIFVRNACYVFCDVVQFVDELSKGIP